jgi:DNA-binding response OmpR family regulator
MRTILIFDSSAVTCHTVSKQLRGNGFDTIQARSISGARVALASKPVDLVILDPAAAEWPSALDASGISLLRELGRDRGHQKAPVIILTSSARDSDRIDARVAGAVAFLTKPVSTRELLFTVNNALGLQAPATQASAQEARAGRQAVGQVDPRRPEHGPGKPAPRFPLRADSRPDWELAAAPPQSRAVQ